MLVDVVDVDSPLRVVKSGCPPILDQHRGLVAIVFQYEVNVTAGLVRGDARPDGARHLLQQMLAAEILDLIHRIETQPVEPVFAQPVERVRSEKHTSELTSLMRIPYAVFSS